MPIVKSDDARDVFRKSGFHSGDQSRDHKRKGMRSDKSRGHRQKSGEIAIFFTTLISMSTEYKQVLRKEICVGSPQTDESLSASPLNADLT